MEYTTVRALLFLFSFGIIDTNDFRKFMHGGYVGAGTGAGSASISGMMGTRVKTRVETRVETRVGTSVSRIRNQVEIGKRCLNFVGWSFRQITAKNSKLIKSTIIGNVLTSSLPRT